MSAHPHAGSQRWTTVRDREAIYRDAVALLAADLRTPLAIDAVARALPTSRRQLQRAFEEVGGTTFSAHVAALRMDRALLLLTSTSATVAEIADEVGYSDPSQLRRAFRRRFGVSPTAVRQLAARRRAAG